MRRCAAASKRQTPKETFGPAFARCIGDGSSRLARCKVPVYAEKASAGKLAPLLAAQAMAYQFDAGGSQRRSAKR